MNKIYLTLISTALLIGFAACSDDNLMEESEKIEQVESNEDGEPLAIMVENSEMRTRDVDFGEEAPVRINRVWLGVFDKKTGYCVSKYDGSSGYAFVSTGNKAYGIVRHKLPAPSVPAGINLSGTYFMIAVVNYGGVNGRWNSDVNQEYPLETMLAQVDTWEKFNSIGVDTGTAYNDDHAKDTPVMVGFLNKADYDSGSPASSHIKIDQFKQSSTNPVELTMDSQSNIDLKFSNNKWETTSKTLLLRRLVSNITFYISAKEGLEVTSIQYRRHNEPKAVYIVERTMLATQTVDGNEEGKFPKNAKYSPNFAALRPQDGYSSETNFTKANQLDENRWMINYQHFANKHWSDKTLTKYSEREDYKLDQNGNKIFSALASSLSDINNYASYIELNMHILDRNRNRCADATFIIHEGYTSNHDGSLKEDGGIDDVTIETKLKDFSCARNRNYTYNVTVNGFDNLSFNVIKDKLDFFSDQITEHRADQCGKVWTFNYIGDKEDALQTGVSNFHYFTGVDNKTYGGFDNYLTGGGTVNIPENPNDPADKNVFYTIYPGALTFDKDNPVLAFRIYGYDSETQEEGSTNTDVGSIQGYNYNFEEVSFEYLKGMWPPSATHSHYYRDYNALVTDYYMGVAEAELDARIVAENEDENRIKDEVIYYLRGRQSSVNSLLFKTFKFRVKGGEGGPVLKHTEENPMLEDIEFVGQTINGEITNKWPIKLSIDIDMNKPMDIEQFMRAMNYLIKKEKPIPREFDILISSRHSERIKAATAAGKEEADLVRCLYITDRSGADDWDECTKAVTVFAAIQGIEDIE